MAWSRILECPDCGYSWRHLAMSKGERNPPCPECAARPGEALAAPALNSGVGAATSIRVPENKTKAIDFAMRAISDDNGGANMQTRSRPGEAVAIAPTVRERERPFWGGAGPAGVKIGVGDLPALNARDGGNDARAQLIESAHQRTGQVSRRHAHMKPVYRDPKTGRAT